uniref:Uncharacterized protein n=1 Tax=Arundo donax TaxID=35708 RepID=A0A0A9HPT0_ARUDO
MTMQSCKHNVLFFFFNSEGSILM